MSAVYKAIAAVMGELAQTGISKARKNVQQGYSFRGIDDVYNALAPILSRHGLLMLPRVESRECVERLTAKGTALFYVTVAVEYTLVAAEDGSTHVIRTYGEAMDSGDKATNKAMSAAYKYAAMQAFAIPTEGDNDADLTTHADVLPANNAERDTLLSEVRDLLAATDTQEAALVAAYARAGHALTDLATAPLEALRSIRSALAKKLAKKEAA
jgi:hypothetical protein